MGGFYALFLFCGYLRAVFTTPCLPCKCWGHSTLNCWGLWMCWLSRTEPSQTKDTWLNVDPISWVVNAKSEKEWKPQRSVSSLPSSHSVRGGECLHVCHALQMACCALTPQRRAIHHPFGSNIIILFLSLPVVFLSLFWPFLLNYRYYDDLGSPWENTLSFPQHACSPHQLWSEWLSRTGYRCAAWREKWQGSKDLGVICLYDSL